MRCGAGGAAPPAGAGGGHRHRGLRGRQGDTRTLPRHLQALRRAPPVGRQPLPAVRVDKNISSIQTKKYLYSQKNILRYENDEKMFLGQSRYDPNTFGWAGHREDGGHFTVQGAVMFLMLETLTDCV